jgi:dnd system-associated protein 4
MEPNENGSRDRIHIEDATMELYKALTDSSNKEQSPFETYKDVFLLAACLGYKNGRRRKLSPGSKTTIRLDVFREEGVGLMKAIAIAETKDVIVLQQLNDVLTIVEEYANSGIYDLKAQLLDERGRPLWNLVDLLHS